MPQPQEYTVKSWQPWEDKDNDGAPVRDLHGNFRGSVLFDEDSSEPIDATFKTQPNPGDKKYGVVDLYQTRAGKTRKGFKSAPRPQPGYGGTPAAPAQQAGQVAAKYQSSDDRQSEIKAEWAIGQAVQASARKFPEAGYYTEIAELATNFYALVDRVKRSPQEWGALAQMQAENGTTTQYAQSGYDKARNQAQQIRERQPEPSTMPFEGEQCPIEDVPPEYR